MDTTEAGLVVVVHNKRRYAIPVNAAGVQVGFPVLFGNPNRLKRRGYGPGTVDGPHLSRSSSNVASTSSDGTNSSMSSDGAPPQRDCSLRSSTTVSFREAVTEAEADDSDGELMVMPLVAASAAVTAAPQVSILRRRSARRRELPALFDFDYEAPHTPQRSPARGSDTAPTSTPTSPPVAASVIPVEAERSHRRPSVSPPLHVTPERHRPASPTQQCSVTGKRSTALSAQRGPPPASPQVSSRPSKAVAPAPRAPTRTSATQARCARCASPPPPPLASVAACPLQRLAAATPTAPCRAPYSPPLSATPNAEARVSGAADWVRLPVKGSPARANRPRDQSSHNTPTRSGGDTAAVPPRVVGSSQSPSIPDSDVSRIASDLTMGTYGGYSMPSLSHGPDSGARDRPPSPRATKAEEATTSHASDQGDDYPYPYTSSLLGRSDDTHEAPSPALSTSGGAAPEKTSATSSPAYGSTATLPEPPDTASHTTLEQRESDGSKECVRSPSSITVDLLVASTSAVSPSISCPSVLSAQQSVPHNLPSPRPPLPDSRGRGAAWALDALPSLLQRFVFPGKTRQSPFNTTTTTAPTPDTVETADDLYDMYGTCAYSQPPLSHQARRTLDSDSPRYSPSPPSSSSSPSSDDGDNGFDKDSTGKVDDGAESAEDLCAASPAESVASRSPGHQRPYPTPVGAAEPKPSWGWSTIRARLTQPLLVDGQCAQDWQLPELLPRYRATVQAQEREAARLRSCSDGNGQADPLCLRRRPKRASH
ncbi:hypothetical protein NESM_000461200 [Novymonas esmeraldas]|uniref:Uncharacterized protein n=1 Tax=Novymonas esmeraldas TaxID=1808958 RepID=A0AAW0EMS1_9TRYP